MVSIIGRKKDREERSRFEGLGEENIDKYRGAEQRRFEGLGEEKIQKSREDKMVWLKKRYRGAE